MANPRIVNTVRTSQPAGDPATCPRTQQMVASLQAVLRQADDLCARLDDVQFSSRCSALGNSTIGQHLRHCLDHFDQFLDGVSEGFVDYDSRLRDAACEQRLDRAQQRVDGIRDRLDRDLASVLADRPVRVRQACQSDTDAEVEPSTCGRELQFLLSHTVHHFAMVAAICRLQGVDVPSDYGVAPSTLRHRRES